jgi:multiple sugar transport system permease protein
MREDRLRKSFVLGGTVCMLVFSLLPFVYMVMVGFASRVDFLRGGIPLRLTLDHFRAVLTGGSLHFLDYLVNSLVVSACSALFAVLIAALAAYALTRLPVPGKALILMLTLMTSMFPQISLISYLFQLMTALGWINTHAALIFPYIAWSLPLALWILVSYFARIPRDLDRAALVDGCNRRQVLYRVIFPVAAPALFSTFLLIFIFAFNEFLFALMLTTDFRSRTIPVGIALFQGLHGQTPWGEIMAAATVATLPVVVLTLLFQRRIVQGLTRGAVKG